MSEFGPQIAADVLAACQAGAGEASEALSRALDGSLKLEPGQPGTIDLAAAPQDLAGPGLAILLNVGSAGALVLLAESSGILPGWYAAPDPTGVSKLTTLAQELGMLLLPEAFMPEDFKAARVGNLRACLERSGAAAGAGWLPLSLKGESNAGTLHLIWPISQPAAVYQEAAAAPAANAAPAAAASPPSSAPAAASIKPAAAPAPSAATKPAAAKPAALRELPPYTRSLLQIRVPVVVTLATTQLPVKRIVELVPGTIIQFDKSCEDMLELSAGKCPVAEGEAVKIGEKFGLRVTSLVLPDERFQSVRKPALAQR